jgi:hypothetical protein
LLLWQKNLTNQVYSYIVLYDAADNVLKLFCINTNVKSYLSESTIKEEFLKNITENNIKIAIKNFYKNLYNIIGNKHPIDFYFNINLDTFYNISHKLKKIQKYIYSDNHALQLLDQFSIIKFIFRFTPTFIINAYKHYKLIDTNISKGNFVISILKFKLLNPQCIFYEMPIKLYKQQVILDKQNIQECLDKIYFCTKSISKNIKSNIIIDIKNASAKTRMAEKAAWLLRSKNFDVVSWSNNVINYDKTLIKDYKGNFLQALQLAKIFNTNIIITSYNKEEYADICVILGKDYNIHDILDN